MKALMRKNEESDGVEEVNGEPGHSGASSSQASVAPARKLSLHLTFQRPLLGSHDTPLSKLVSVFAFPSVHIPAFRSRTSSRVFK